jgi:hypothetical protein
MADGVLVIVKGIFGTVMAPCDGRDTLAGGGLTDNLSRKGG